MIFELFLGIGFILIAIALVVFFKKFLINSVTGVVALLLLSILADWAKYPAIKIAITLVTVVVCGFLGLAGVGLLIILKLLGFTLQ